MYYVYIMTNRRHTVLYTGVTNNLMRRVYEHKNKLIDGFTKKYNCTELVYYEEYTDVRLALDREKQLKDFRREKKESLINSLNSKWIDLSNGISH